MRFALLTRFHSRHEHSSFVSRVLEEAAKIGHAFVVVNPNDVTLQHGNPGAAVLWQGQPFPTFDLVNYALRWDDDHTWNVVEALKGMGMRVQPPTRVPMGDSVIMTRLFARAGIETPKTWIFSGPSQLAIVMDELPFPCVFKVRRGQQGRRLYIATHVGEAMQIADMLGAHGHSFVVQEIVEPRGQDIRAFVVGNKVVAAVARTAAAGYLWPREDGNPSVVPIQLTPAEEAMVVAAARVYVAPYAAVSFVRKPTGVPVFLELSRAPTLTEVEHVTGINVAGAIVQHCIHLAAQPQQG